MLDGYKSDMPVAFVGFWGAEDETMVENTDFGTRLTALEFDEYRVVINWAYKEYIARHLGFEPNWVNDEDLEKLQEEEAVKQMTCYPNDGSISIINNTVIVKFGDK